MTETQPTGQWMPIGKIVNAQGMQGEVVVYPESDFPERFVKRGERWLLHPGEESPKSIELLAGRYVSGKNVYVLKLAGITSRDQAEALRGCQLLIPEGDRPHLNPGEFYLPDLIGLTVYNQVNGEIIGHVVSLMSGGNDLLEVELKSSPEVVTNNTKDQKKKSPKNVLIPFVNEIVPIVDIAQGRIEIIPIPGLLDV